MDEENIYKDFIVSHSLVLNKKILIILHMDGEGNMKMTTDLCNI